MGCAGSSCRQGRADCKTPWTCQYASDSYHDAMHAPIRGGFWPRDAADMPITFQGDEPPVTAQGVQLALADWLLWICAGVGLFAAARWIYLNWWAIAALWG